jgi:hypothetical protein
VTQTFQVISEFASPVKKSGNADAAPAVAPETVDPSGWDEDSTAGDGDDDSDRSAQAPQPAPRSSVAPGSSRPLIFGFVALVVVAAGIGYWLFAG